MEDHEWLELRQVGLYKEFIKSGLMDNLEEILLR